MRWSDVRAAYPDQWLVIEALEAHTSGNRRILDRIAVIEVCPDGRATMKRYRELHRIHPGREICFAHTGMVELDIEGRPPVSTGRDVRGDARAAHDEAIARQRVIEEFR